MPINTVEVLSLVTQVCEEEKLQVSIKESLKGGLIAGTTTTIGGLLGGPIGLAIGWFKIRVAGSAWVNFNGGFNK
ncbi:hypothetical protein E2C01_029177 [Portunus trituberculatus]|uniref:Uncharacterized protein n=1 Tax=Portunus trituberculatus TaxID=210409 RepID=A0A5B7ES45_PORTR|nr:hypothetical protein [Portunus trituberculatus]